MWVISCGDFLMISVASIWVFFSNIFFNLEQKNCSVSEYESNPLVDMSAVVYIKRNIIIGFIWMRLDYLPFKVISKSQVIFFMIDMYKLILKFSFICTGMSDFRKCCVEEWCWSSFSGLTFSSVWSERPISKYTGIRFLIKYSQTFNSAIKLNTRVAFYRWCEVFE